MGQEKHDPYPNKDQNETKKMIEFQENNHIDQHTTCNAIDEGCNRTKTRLNQIWAEQEINSTNQQNQLCPS